MVTIEELRIGSYVIHQGRICAVTAISKTGNVYVKPTIGNKSTLTNLSKLEPLTTTREVLEAFGFKLEGTLWRLSKIAVVDNASHISYLVDRDYGKTSIGNGAFVHHLQNLIFEVTNKFPMLP